MWRLRGLPRRGVRRVQVLPRHAEAQRPELAAQAMPPAGLFNAEGAPPASDSICCNSASAPNTSARSRWALTCCYNTKANDPIAESFHPNYRALEVLPDASLIKVGAVAEWSEHSDLLGADVNEGGAAAAGLAGAAGFLPEALGPAAGCRRACPAFGASSFFNGFLGLGAMSLLTPHWRIHQRKQEQGRKHPPFRGGGV